MDEEKKSEDDSRMETLIETAVSVIGLITLEDATNILKAKEEDRNEILKPINSKVINLLTQKGIHYTDIPFIFQLLLKVFDTTSNVVANSVDKVYNMACQKYFGKDIMDITLTDLEDVLKS